MPKLHTLNKPASHTDLIRQLVEAVEADDTLILIEDGVYHVLDIVNGNSAQEVDKHVKMIYVLESDATSRGINQTHDQLVYVSYEQFVELSVTFDSVISWY